MRLMVMVLLIATACGKGGEGWECSVDADCNQGLRCGLLETGDGERAHPVLLADVGDIVSDGSNLSIGVALADHEVVGDRRLASDVEGDHVTRLTEELGFFERPIRGGADGVHGRH